METAAGEATDAAMALRGLPAQLATHADFSEVLASLAAGQAGTLGGVWGSSRALVAAELGRHCPQTLTVVLPHAADVDSLVDDLALFTDAEVEAFPATEADAGDRIVQDENFGGRQRLIKRLATGQAPKIVVTSIQSLLQPLPSV
jgi:transcription-repair coupling factor (superfamily II helicase)